MKIKLFLTISSLLLFSANTSASSFGTFDPRSLAMGGTGVASGDAANASYYNPALLAAPRENDDFSLVVPTVVIGAADPKNLSDALDAYDAANYEITLDNTITTFNASGSAADYIANAGAVGTASQDLLNGINTLSNKEIIFNANAGVVLAVPSESLGFAISANGRASGGALLNITAADNQLIQDYITVLNCVGALPGGSNVVDVINCDASAPSTDVLNDATGDFNNVDTATNMTSTINSRGAAITEAGISLAHKFDVLGGLSIGITPKSISVDTFDYEIGVNVANIDSDTGKKSYSDTNLDVGMAMNLTDNIKLGVVAKNIIEKEYLTILGNTVKIEPQYRAGLAYQNDWILLAADMDLTENKGIGFENNTQYAAVGVELDLLDFFQLRAGLRHNMNSDNPTIDSDIASIGVGFNIFAVQLDLGVAGNSDEISGGLQLAVKF